jgi:hypothetical protein
MRKHLLEKGAEIRYRSKVVDVLREGSETGKLRSLVLEGGEEIPVEFAIFALGHSARDTVGALLSRGVAMTEKPFAMGVRIEHPQDAIDRIQLGGLSESCGVNPADYKQAFMASNMRGVYTFCMCPGGEVIACSSEAGGVVTNGMSRYKRSSGFANAGLVVQTKPEDFGEETSLLRGQVYQRKVEEAAFVLGGETYAAPAIRVTDFLAQRDASASAEDDVRARGRRAPRHASLPYLVAARSAGRSTGRCTGSARAVHRARDANVVPGAHRADAFCESTSMPGLYPLNEGAGFAGIVCRAHGLRSRPRAHRRGPSKARGPHLQRSRY